MISKDRTVRCCVYKHVSPSGKVYIGITSLDPRSRWGNQGSGYKSNKHFWNAIQKYGWDNFTHEVLAENLTIEEASNLEKNLISLYNSSDPEHGYNKTLGGEFGLPTEEIRNKLKQARNRLSQDPEFIDKLRQSLIGHSVSEETRKKISLAHKGKKNLKLSALKKGKPPEAALASIRGKPAWNRGLTKYDHEGIMRGSISMRRPKTEQHKENLSKSQRRKFLEDGYLPIWVNNGVCEKLIDSSKEPVPEGFVRGRLNLDFIYVHKEDTDVESKIVSSDLEKYLSEGWIIGPSSRRKTNQKRSVQKFYWIYEGTRYSSAVELAEYLRNHGYPKIVGSTITSLYNKGFEHSKNYNSLKGKILREEIDHEDKID